MATSSWAGRSRLPVAAVALRSLLAQRTCFPGVNGVLGDAVPRGHLIGGRHASICFNTTMIYAFRVLAVLMCSLFFKFEIILACVQT